MNKRSLRYTFYYNALAAMIIHYITVYGYSLLRNKRSRYLVNYAIALETVTKWSHSHHREPRSEPFIITNRICPLHELQQSKTRPVTPVVSGCGFGCPAPDVCGSSANSASTGKSPASSSSSSTLPLPEETSSPDGGGGSLLACGPHSSTAGEGRSSVSDCSRMVSMRRWDELRLEVRPIAQSALHSDAVSREDASTSRSKNR